MVRSVPAVTTALFAIAIASAGVYGEQAPEQHEMDTAGKTYRQATQQGLGLKAACVFQRACTQCHGNGATQGGFANILNHQALIPQRIVPNDLNKSLIFQKMTAPQGQEMPPHALATQQGRQQQALDVEAIKQWILAGAEPFPANPNCNAPEMPQQNIQQNGAAPRMPQFNPVPGAVGEIKPEHVIRFVRNDLVLQQRNSGLPYNNSPYLYFSLAHLKGTALDTPKDRASFRNALEWAFALTTYNREHVVPEQVDADGYIFRVDSRKLGWPPGAFLRIKADDKLLNEQVLRGRRRLLSPLAGDPRNATLEKAISTTVPLDFFLTQVAKGPVYRMLLGIPDKEQAFLGAYNRQMALTNASYGQPPPGGGRAEMYSVIDSKAERFNRQLEYHETNTGRFPRFLRTSNHGSNLGDQSVLDRPLTGVVDSNLQTKPADHDYVALLPNGLPLVVNYLDDGNINPETDEKGPMFCLQCHLPQKGAFATKDQGRGELMARAMAGQFPPNVAQRIPYAYPGDPQLQARLKTFHEAFTNFENGMSIVKIPDKEIEGAQFVPRMGNVDPHYTNFGGSPLIASVFRASKKPTLEAIAGMVGVGVPTLMRMIRSNPQYFAIMGNLTDPNAIPNIPPDQFNVILADLMVKASYFDYNEQMLRRGAR